MLRHVYSKLFQFLRLALTIVPSPLKFYDIYLDPLKKKKTGKYCIVSLDRKKGWDYYTITLQLLSESEISSQILVQVRKPRTSWPFKFIYLTFIINSRFHIAGSSRGL